MSEPADQPDQSERPKRRTGLAAAGAQDFSLAAAIGGPRGALESLVPPVLFVVVYTITSELRASLIAAVGVSVVFLLARVITRSAPTQAISGVIGVALCAVFALRTGQARDFFLPGFFINAGYGTAFLLSLIPLPRIRAGARELAAGSYPLLGLVLGFLLGEGLAWRDQPQRRRAYRRLTVAWAAFFWLKVIVQVPLYLTEQVQALGVAKVAMGVPAYAFMCWLTWQVLRRIPTAKPAAD